MMDKRSLTNRFCSLLLLVVALLSASCSNPWVPAELKMNKVVYEAKVEHFVGPGGINQSFVVYELPKEVAATVADKGLAYLNSLPTKKQEASTSTGPFARSFDNWQATPVPAEKAWLRYGRDLGKDWKPSLATFYVSFKGDNGKDAFIASIPPAFSDAFHAAISAPDNFYAYGDYRGKCLLVVSPRTGKAFYLFRD